MPQSRGRGPHPVDIHVGRRVCERRLELGLSQSDLARALGITFQQVQKYERGVNRISASKLWQAAGLLEVEIESFFEGLAGADASEAGEDPPVDLSAPPTRQTIELQRLAARLPARRQRLICEVVRTLVGRPDQN